MRVERAIRMCPDWSMPITVSAGGLGSMDSNILPQDRLAWKMLSGSEKTAVTAIVLCMI